MIDNHDEHLKLHLELADKMRAEQLAREIESMRPKFAAMAMQGILANEGYAGYGEHVKREVAIISAIQYADALIAALQEPSEPK